MAIPQFEERWSGGYIFENEWQSFRTRQNRELDMITAVHTYDRASIMVSNPATNAAASAKSSAKMRANACAQNSVRQFYWTSVSLRARWISSAEIVEERVRCKNGPNEKVHLYDWTTPAIWGGLVEICVGADGTYCQVQEHYSNNEFANPEALKKPYDHPRNFYPAGGLPPHSVLVVRTSALRDLEARLSEPDQKVEKPIERRERSTLLVIIAALSKLAKIDVTKHSGAAVAIESETVRMGARVAARTIEDHLKRIPDALEARGK